MGRGKRRHVLRGWMVFSVVVGFVGGCSTKPATQPAQFITERDARLISIAREAAALEGFSLVDAIYQVRRHGDGWIVTVDKVPGYAGEGEPLVVVDATFFVKLTADERVSEILSYGRWVRPTTRALPDRNTTQD